MRVGILPLVMLELFYPLNRFVVKFFAHAYGHSSPCICWDYFIPLIGLWLSWVYSDCGLYDGLIYVAG